MSIRRVLLIDDDIASDVPGIAPGGSYMWYYSEALRDAGVDVEEIDNVDRALEMVSAPDKYDLVVLDVMMPPGRTFVATDTDAGLHTGVLVGERIRKVRPEIPIVVLTNTDNAQSLQQLSNNPSVKRIVSKPNCPPFEFSDVIGDVLDARDRAEWKSLMDDVKGRDASRVFTGTLRDKLENGVFDVFLCHNSDDKPLVRKIADRLKEEGILPWFDESDLRPGLSWIDGLESGVLNVKSAAVFVGANGVGPWQRQEIDAFLQELVNRECPVMPCILRNCKNDPEVPLFLRRMTRVDFRKKSPDPFDRLVWGITGRKHEV